MSEAASLQTHSSRQGFSGGWVKGHRTAGGGSMHVSLPSIGNHNSLIEHHHSGRDAFGALRMVCHPRAPRPGNAGSAGPRDERGMTYITHRLCRSVKRSRELANPTMPRSAALLGRTTPRRRGGGPTGAAPRVAPAGLNRSLLVARSIKGRVSEFFFARDELISVHRAPGLFGLPIASRRMLA
jgi:hypothetical protein